MTDRIDDLRDIYSRLEGTAEFIEPQQEARGTVRSRAAVDRDARALVAELREAGGFRTVLSDDDLVSVARAFHAGRSDREVATEIGVSPDTVFRARMNLHLFADTDTPPAFDDVARRVRGKDSRAAIAADLGVPRATVDRVARLLTAQEAARRVNYRYTVEFADLFDGDAAGVELDRLVWEDRRALVDAHDD